MEQGSETYRRATDRDLIRMCLRGDEQAWIALLERYGRLIYSLAWRAGLPPEDIADVFQSVCVVIVENLQKLKDETKFRSWVATITVRQCARVQRRQPPEWVSLEQARQELSEQPDASPLPLEEIERLEREQLVRQALEEIGEPCRHLLTRLFYEKELWSYAEIARELGVAVSSIGPMRARCLKRLLGALERLGF